jgi:hypothetical protein
MENDKNENKALSQTSVSTCFSESAIRQAKKLYEKYLSVCAYHKSIDLIDGFQIKNIGFRLKMHFTSCSQ